tara:strand:- start:1028 stop:1756 length:729 start_codon:yes stop_codon:yes gene_type:complete
MTIAFAWSQVSTVTKQVDTGGTHSDQWVTTAAGCDSLTGDRYVIGSYQKEKYIRFQDNLVFFSGTGPTIERIKRSDVLKKALAYAPEYSLYEYHDQIMKWAIPEKSNKGLSGVHTLIVNGRTGGITTVTTSGSVCEADVHREVTPVDDLPNGVCADSTVFRFAAVGSGSDLATGVIDVNVIQQGGLDCSQSERELCLMILRAAERHEKGCGGIPRVFSSSVEIDLGSPTDDSEVKWEFLGRE